MNQNAVFVDVQGFYSRLKEQDPDRAEGFLHQPAVWLDKIIALSGPAAQLSRMTKQNAFLKAYAPRDFLSNDQRLEWRLAGFDLTDIETIPGYETPVLQALTLDVALTASHHTRLSHLLLLTEAFDFSPLKRFVRQQGLVLAAVGDAGDSPLLIAGMKALSISQVLSEIPLFSPGRPDKKNETVIENDSLKYSASQGQSSHKSAPEEAMTGSGVLTSSLDNVYEEPSEVSLIEDFAKAVEEGEADNDALTDESFASQDNISIHESSQEDASPKQNNEDVSFQGDQVSSVQPLSSQEEMPVETAFSDPFVETSPAFPASDVETVVNNGSGDEFSPDSFDVQSQMDDLSEVHEALHHSEDKQLSGPDEAEDSLVQSEPVVHNPQSETLDAPVDSLALHEGDDERDKAGESADEGFPVEPSNVSVTSQNQADITAILAALTSQRLNTPAQDIVAHQATSKTQTALAVSSDKIMTPREMLDVLTQPTDRVAIETIPAKGAEPNQQSSTILNEEERKKQELVEALQAVKDSLEQSSRQKNDGLSGSSDNKPMRRSPFAKGETPIENSILEDDHVFAEPDTLTLSDEAFSAVPSNMGGEQEQESVIVSKQSNSVADEEHLTALQPSSEAFPASEAGEEIVSSRSIDEEVDALLERLLAEEEAEAARSTPANPRDQNRRSGFFSSLMN
jgi:hypothetical protein